MFRLIVQFQENIKLAFRNFPSHRSCRNILMPSTWRFIGEWAALLDRRVWLVLTRINGIFLLVIIDPLDWNRINLLLFKDNAHYSRHIYLQPFTIFIFQKKSSKTKKKNVHGLFRIFNCIIFYNLAFRVIGPVIKQL